MQKRVWKRTDWRCRCAQDGGSEEGEEQEEFVWHLHFEKCVGAWASGVLSEVGALVLDDLIARGLFRVWGLII